MFPPNFKLFSLLPRATYYTTSNLQEHKGTEECGLKDYKKYIKIANHLGFSSKLGNLIEVEGKATWTKMEQELERCKNDTCFISLKLSRNF